MKKIILFIIILSIGFTANPRYGDKQIRSMLKEYFVAENNAPDLLGIRIFKGKKGKVFQIDIESTLSSKKNDIILSFRALARVGSYAKIPFRKFIVVCHLPGNLVPSVAESQANCAIKYFIRGKITEQKWRQDCLIERKL
ncbi:uncharacterized protein METZ01_LOCUS346401 [marine metagenome]|jgi:hypothetical protein|uniref:Uncharacterized protein n=1 Tax=marine metagenome TaxID=408172 RepID=A0A382R8T2_9ZZZZ|tara:strand:- start:1075 stop:1494 length:420 start_codon:yes stop_codon:yes gene_type:complete